MPKLSGRLLSLDAYRGFVMLAMVTEGLALSHVAESMGNQGVWQFLGYQARHVQWTGCSFWDLIQPSFMFIVGVSLPFSFARRKAGGESAVRRGLHVAWRAAFLIALGIFLRSANGSETHFTFEDVTTQIGLGYILAYLTLELAPWRQIAAAVLILIGYWLLFALWPLPTPELAASLGVPGDWSQFSGFAAHWDKHLNAAGAFDRWFLNLFPRSEPFVANGGGYQTLNFVPSAATITFGVIVGGMLRREIPLAAKVLHLAVGGIAMLLLGMSLDGHIWPLVNWDWSICPIVKRIWTPSWTVFSTGWTLLMLAGFVWLIDLKGYRRWTFPFVVVGMNSIAIYCLSWLWRPWLVSTAQIHLGSDVFDGVWGPTFRELYVTMILWCVCLWLYNRRIFIRV